MYLSRKDNARNLGGLFTALVIAAMFLTPAMGALADTEPNNSISTAEWISSGQTVTGTLDELTDAYDYYTISLNSGDTLTATLSGSGTNFDLYLYNDAGTVLTSSTGAISFEMLTYTAGTGGSYYIAPYAQSGSGSYTLTVTVLPGSGAPSGNLYVGGAPYTPGAPKAELPALTVGNSVNWGGVKDIGKEFQNQLQENLTKLENMGFTVKLDVSGGLGAYFGMEVVSDSADIGGAKCYEIKVTGAFAIDFGLDVSVSGSTTMYNNPVSIDGTGSGYIRGEANLDGHIYLTVDEMALAKIDLTFKADAHAELNADATMTAQGQTNTLTASASLDIDKAQIDFLLTFEPPLDMYQYPFWEGKKWYVPGFDTTASGSVSAQGTVSSKVDAVIPYRPAVHKSNSTNLATEFGSSSFSRTIPGGQPGLGPGGTLFTCTKAAGNVFIIETETGNAFGHISLPGTRQAGIPGMPDMNSMMPTTGVQYSADTGMITGATVDGAPMTSEVTAADVSSFSADPLGEVTKTTGGHATGLSAGLLGIILVGVIVIIVVIVVVMLLARKKTPQVRHHPQEYQQQPPPPPPEYQTQQGQYQQQPGDQYQQPPPPPPPG